MTHSQEQLAAVKLAGRRYTPPFREYRPTPHLRQAEIDAAPRQISMGGIGNSNTCLGGREARD